MSLGTGVGKQVRYKLETTWATPPGASGAQILRRVTSDLALKKATFESGELLSTYQRQDFRHGTKSVEGTINGELSPGTYKDLLGAVLRRAPTTVTAISSLSITIAGTGPTYTVTRSTGDFLAGGIKAGMVVRLTAGTFNAANLNKNLVVCSLTATVLTVMPLNGVALVAEGPIASATLTVPGKVNFVPTTGHLNQSFAFEHYHSDISPVQSERFDGCKINQTDLAFPPQGMSTVGFAVMGRTMVDATAQYFTSPTAETTFGLLAAANGIILVNGAASGIVTGFNFSIKGNMTAEPVSGSDLYADITPGNVQADGQLTAFFQDAVMRDLFVDESEASIAIILPTGTGAAADFMSFVLPRIKFGAADKDDGNKALIQTLPFTALENVSGGTGTSSERTTVWVQDSQG
jgi:hypothetical protein